MRNKFKWFTLGWVTCLIIACGIIELNPLNMSEPPSKPASVCAYKVAFTYRASFKTEEDFRHSVESLVGYLERHGYEILELKYVYDYNMVRKLVVKFATIKYREMKNVKKQKEGN